MDREALLTKYFNRKLKDISTCFLWHTLLIEDGNSYQFVIVNRISYCIPSLSSIVAIAVPGSPATQLSVSGTIVRLSVTGSPHMLLSEIGKKDVALVAPVVILIVSLPSNTCTKTGTDNGPLRRFTPISSCPPSTAV